MFIGAFINVEADIVAAIAIIVYISCSELH